MSDPTVEIPEEMPLTDVPNADGVTIEPVDEPVVPPARHVHINMYFETEGEPDSVYSSKLEHPYGSDPTQYAKVVAEIVERTTMLHLGALPVLQKQEVAA